MLQQHSIYVLTHGTEYEILTSIPKDTVVTRIKKVTRNGEEWSKVILKNGAVGYAFSSYLKEVVQPEWNVKFDES